MKERITKLPKWAQKLINNKNNEVEKLRETIIDLESRHALLCDYEWFTLGVSMTETRSLFLLDKDSVNPIASIGRGDILWVGRNKRVLCESCSVDCQYGKSGTKKHVYSCLHYIKV